MSSPTSHVSPTPELSTPPRATDPLSTGIKSLLDPTVKQTTEKLLQVHQSQQALSQELDRLITQLQHYLDTTDPPSLRPTVIKLASTSKRLAAVNTTLQAIQLRVNKLYVQLSKQRLPHH